MKKLLILGAYNTEIEILNCAKNKGLYTIVTDSNTDWKKAPAKYIADEAWNISWSNIEELRDKCLIENVDGVIAGFSEKRVYYANELAKVINKPFYVSNSDLETIIDKLKFKNKCIKCGIRVPKNYNINDNIIFPVIVKPCDNGGSKGISICYNRNELDIAYKEALNWSITKSVVIEEYLKSDEIMVYFTVHNGNVTVSAMCDRIMHQVNKNITQLPVAYNYSSKYYEVFIKYNLEKFKKLITSLNIKDGLIAFQCFVVDKDVIPFDPTYRLDGTLTYYFTKHNNDISALEMLIDYSINGSMGNDEEIISKENPSFNNISFELPILLKKGTIRKIEGLNDIRNIKGIINVYQSLNEGAVLEKEADFLQMLCRIFIVVSNINELEKTIDQIFSTLKVNDENNEDMILYRFDVKKIISR